MTPEQITRLRELLQTEMTLGEIAREFGMTYWLFRIRIAESGLKIQRQLVDLNAERERKERMTPVPGSTVYGIDRDGNPYEFVAGNGVDIPDGPRVYRERVKTVPITERDTVPA